MLKKLKVAALITIAICGVLAYKKYTENQEAKSIEVKVPAEMPNEEEADKKA